MATVNGEDAEFSIDLSGLPVAAQRAVKRAIGTSDLDIPEAAELDAVKARLDEDVTAVGELTPDPDQSDRQFYEGFYAGTAHGLRIAKLALERRASELRGEG